MKAVLVDKESLVSWLTQSSSPEQISFAEDFIRSYFLTILSVFNFSEPRYTWVFGRCRADEASVVACVYI